jgi:hypothetical protein
MFAILVLLAIVIYNDFNKTSIVDDVQAFVSNIVISGENTNIETQEPELVQNLLSSSQTTEVVTQKSDSKVEKYFYNQLDSYSKIIYEALENNKEHRNRFFRYTI